MTEHMNALRTDVGTRMNAVEGRLDVMSKDQAEYNDSLSRHSAAKHLGLEQQLRNVSHHLGENHANNKTFAPAFRDPVGASRSMVVDDHGAGSARGYASGYGAGLACGCAGGYGAGAAGGWAGGYGPAAADARCHPRHVGGAGGYDSGVMGGYMDGYGSAPADARYHPSGMGYPNAAMPPFREYAGCGRCGEAHGAALLAPVTTRTGFPGSGQSPEFAQPPPPSPGMRYGTPGTGPPRPPPSANMRNDPLAARWPPQGSTHPSHTGNGPALGSGAKGASICGPNGRALEYSSFDFVEFKDLHDKVKKLLNAYSAEEWESVKMVLNCLYCGGPHRTGQCPGIYSYSGQCLAKMGPLKQKSLIERYEIKAAAMRAQAAGQNVMYAAPEEDVPFCQLNCVQEAMATDRQFLVSLYEAFDIRPDSGTTEVLARMDEARAYVEHLAELHRLDTVGPSASPPAAAGIGGSQPCVQPDGLGSVPATPPAGAAPQHAA